MRQDEKRENRRKVILAVMLLVIFVCVVFTWTVVGAIDSYNQQRTENTGNINAKVTGEAVTGSMVSIEIMPPSTNEKEGED